MEGGCECELRVREAPRAEYRTVNARSTNEGLMHVQLSRCSSVRNVPSESKSNQRGMIISAAQARLLYMRATGAMLLWSDRP